MVIFQSFPAYIVKIWNDPIETRISKRVEFGVPGSSSNNNQNPPVVLSIFFILARSILDTRVFVSKCSGE